uniref:Transposable element P transposase-like RNase H domain-containing protein n=1 Tax=Glossina pallidipes TaxID=7398 RepID=A0A1A9ZY15_GLOPL
MKINVGRSSEDFRGFEETNRENNSRVPNLDKLIGETIDEKAMELIDKYIDNYTEETVKDHFNEMIDKRIREIVTATFGETTGEQTTTSQSPANIDINKVDYLDIYDDGPSTSAAAALRLAAQHSSNKNVTTSSNENLINGTLVSELLENYPELWSLQKVEGRIDWKALGKDLADKLSERIGLTNAVAKITAEVLSRGEVPTNDGVPVEANDGVPVEANDGAPVEANDGVPVEANDGVPVEANDGVPSDDLDDFHGFEENEEPTTSTEARLRARRHGLEETRENEEPTTSTEARLKRRAREIDQTPTTTTQAAKRLKAQHLQPFDADEEDRVVPNIDKLREVVSKLSAHDKIVQLHFDEVFTNNTTVYSRSKDKLYGCGYVLRRRCKTLETKEHRTVLVCGVRSLLTSFNIVLSAYPLTSSVGYGHLIEENIKYAVAIGLEMKVNDINVSQGSQRERMHSCEPKIKTCLTNSFMPNDCC